MLHFGGLTISKSHIERAIPIILKHRFYFSRFSMNHGPHYGDTITVSQVPLMHRRKTGFALWKKFSWSVLNFIERFKIRAVEVLETFGIRNQAGLGDLCQLKASTIPFQHHSNCHNGGSNLAVKFIFVDVLADFIC